MDTSPTPVAPRSTEELHQEIRSLRYQLGWAHYFGLGLAIAVALLVYRLDRIQKHALEIQIPVTQRFLEEQAKMGRAVAELQKYAGTHPDYAALLKKYGVDPIAPTNASAAKPPAAAAPAKK